MSGLFQRALELIRHNTETPSGDGVVFDEESGISREDQQEILAEIDHVVQDNRITVSPDTLKIQAQKRGTLFPVLVNVFSVVLLAAGGIGFYLLFQRGESGLREEVGALSTAEGKLIEELKKESEAQLLEKNREINRIQDRLQEIDQERLDLQANMDARISVREEELRLALEAELKAERERLQQQGISEADITLRIQELESRRFEDYQQELVAFRRQAEDERRQAEANLESLQQEYESSLRQANQERVRVLEESQAREARLREQLDARTQALERETQAARQELNRISEQREKEELAARQLVGLYDRVKADLAAGRFEQALRSLDDVREYLNDPKIATLPSMLERRNIEIFVVDSITALVRGEMSKKEVDTSSLIAAANMVNDLKTRVIQADDLYKQGQVERAEVLYREALALIPEVSRSHEYFLSRAQTRDRAREVQLRDYLQRAEAAFQRGEYEATLATYTRALEYLPEEPATIERIISQVRQAGFQIGLLRLRRDQSAAAADVLSRADRLLGDGQHSAAFTGYMELIRRYPNSDQAAAAVEGINRVVETLAARSGGDVTSLRQTLEEKDARIAELETELEEKTAELAKLQAQPAGRTGSDADLQSELAEKEAEIAALRAELAKITGDAEARQRNTDERLGKLEEELAAKVALIDTLQNEKTSLEKEMTSLRQEIQELQAALATASGDSMRGEASGAAQLSEQLREVIARAEAAEARAQAAEGRTREAEARAQAAEAQSQDARTRAEAAEARIRELTTKLERLVALEARYNRLVSSYQDYVTKETSLLASRGSSALIESKVHLNAFLSSAEETFPGLWARIKRYDEAFEKSGRAGAAQEISQILYELSFLSDPAERAEFLDGESRRYPDDPLMRELLEELRELSAVGGTSGMAPTFNRYLDLLASEGSLDTSQMSLLDQLALRASRESREDFLSTELLRARDNNDTPLVRLIEDLLALVRRS